MRCVRADPLLTHFPVRAVLIGHWAAWDENARVRKPFVGKDLHVIAGERIRTADVQLGKKPSRTRKPRQDKH